MNKDSTAVIPLESNPDVFDKFAYNLGLLKSYSFNDIFSIDDPSLLDFLPRPMVAIILLFPIQNTKPSLSSSSSSQSSTTKESTPIWLKQNFQNACGLYALLHILINNKHLLQKDSILYDFLQQNNTLSSDQIDKFIISFTNKFNQDFNESSGETTNPNPEDEIDLHFISFISFKGKLWEMDGRSTDQVPLCLGNVTMNNNNNNNITVNSNNEIDLVDQPIVLNRIKSYMDTVQSESDKLNFSLLGLSRSWD